MKDNRLAAVVRTYGWLLPTGRKHLYSDLRAKVKQIAAVVGNNDFVFDALQVLAHAPEGGTFINHNPFDEPSRISQASS